MKLSMKSKKNKRVDEDWKKVLSEIYNHAPYIYSGAPYTYGDDHPLAKRLKIKGFELGNIMAFLEAQGLIDRSYDEQEASWVSITTKGFDVVSKIKGDEKASKVNKGTLFLSLTIAVAMVIQLLIGIDDIYQKYIISGLFVAALVFGGLVIIKSKL